MRRDVVIERQMRRRGTRPRCRGSRSPLGLYSDWTALFEVDGPHITARPFEAPLAQISISVPMTMVRLGGRAKVWPGLAALWASSKKRCLRHIAMPWLRPRARVAWERK